MFTACPCLQPVPAFYSHSVERGTLFSKVLLQELLSSGVLGGQGRVDVAVLASCVILKVVAVVFGEKEHRR